jgi:hypothetical protein
MKDDPIAREMMVRGTPWLLSNAELGRAAGFTLADAYALALKGGYLESIDPIEFGAMTPAEQQQCLKQSVAMVTS